ncbi:multiple epidermal growth factor-like domains protein 11 [Hydra vulgaris]|uniref:multiple epidermal growth factor-like domains protein 11 n=1 Tax=Hydra vulgaris TaxID=6087 RepID=UPI001F5F9F39|nr:multiple epidermal growth factor-like domains protein 11 [Hydra vulgaris]
MNLKMFTSLFILGTIIQKFVFSADSSSMATCIGAGLNCSSYCSQCFPGGWCVQDENGLNTGKCLCNYGWTGPLASYIKNTANPEWGKNRVTALNCATPCHYTYAVRNQACAADSLSAKCDPTVCESNQRGKCIDGVCQCCKGWSGVNAIYKNDRYNTDGVIFKCDKQCPYLGPGKQHPSCKPASVPSSCNSKCVLNDGKCNEKTGRCLCCEGWTGENAQFEDDGGISVAGYCNVYCPYVKTLDLCQRNLLCVNPDYIKRSAI